jgi:hypothetical protein
MVIPVENQRGLSIKGSAQNLASGSIEQLRINKGNPNETSSRSYSPASTSNLLVLSIASSVQLGVGDEPKNVKGGQP